MNGTPARPQLQKAPSKKRWNIIYCILVCETQLGQAPTPSTGVPPGCSLPAAAAAAAATAAVAAAAAAAAVAAAAAARAARAICST